MSKLVEHKSERNTTRKEAIGISELQNHKELHL